MLKLFDMIHKAERRLHNRTGRDISTPAARRGAWMHFLFLDHGILRYLWTNLYQIAPGVWRSNQPGPGRLKRYSDMGIRTVLNLRGNAKHAHYLFEQEACDELGLTLINLSLGARQAPGRDKLLDLIDLFERMEKPFVMHCKSGADRAGLASAIYLLTQEGASPEAALAQLSPRYLHLKFSKTGILDQVLTDYRDRNAEAPIAFRDWVATEYDPQVSTQAFAASRRRA